MRARISLLLLIVTCIGCDPVDNLRFTNQSNDFIFIEISFNAKFDSYPIRKDAAGDTLWDHMSFYSAGDSAKLPIIGRSAWRNLIFEKSPDSTLTIFIFDKKLLKGVVPDSLVRQQIYTKKYSYKVKDLEKLNWRVEYK